MNRCAEMGLPSGLPQPGADRHGLRSWGISSSLERRMTFFRAGELLHSPDRGHQGAGCRASSPGGHWAGMTGRFKPNALIPAWWTAMLGSNGMS